MSSKEHPVSNESAMSPNYLDKLFQEYLASLDLNPQTLDPETLQQHRETFEKVYLPTLGLSSVVVNVINYKIIRERLAESTNI